MITQGIAQLFLKYEISQRDIDDTTRLYKIYNVFMNSNVYNI